MINRFIYCGNVELKNLQGPDVLKLLIAVDELNIQPLISHVQEFLIEHKMEFLQQNPTGILETVYQHETFTDLWDFCLEFICKEPKTLFNSDRFVNLKAPLLELLLKRDDLDLDEIEIWESLLKWCFAQQNVINNPTNWSKDDITNIERAIHRFIPLIRFYDIEPADFFYKVYCYKDILPQDLIHNLLEFHIVPNMKPKADAPPSRKPKSLIKPEHIPLFASWIDTRKSSIHYNKENVPYDFKLLYRSSRDGYTSKDFHKNCDKKGATIWIAKIQGSTQLIGGYNPLDWSGNSWKNTKDSFQFSMGDGKDISTAKLGYVNNANYAVFCRGDYGPYMGNLYFYDGKWCNDGGNYYPNIGIPKVYFTVENVEVFQVIKREIDI